MLFDYDNATATWTIQLEPGEVHAWARYRARLQEQERGPVTQKAAMKGLVTEAWKAARQWARSATKAAQDRAFQAADAATQEAARDAADAALAAVIGFDPEA